MRKRPEAGPRNPADFKRLDRRSGGWEQRLKNISAEDRERFEENKKKWESLSAEEQKELREKARAMRERAGHQVDKLLTELGLTLDDDQRRAFAQRYMEERRKLERELGQEMQKLRSERLKALGQTLKSEFSKSD